MSLVFRALTSAIVLASVCVGSAAAQKSIDLNLGLSASKSVLGLSYTDGMNQYNAGLRGIIYNNIRGYFVNPGFAYNRYLTRNGFYATAIYTFYYIDWEDSEIRFSGSDYSIVKTRDKGWGSGLLMTGLGKSFQFRHWGLHADAGVATPATSDIGEKWGVWYGGAVSYRFHLD